MKKEFVLQHEERSGKSIIRTVIFIARRDCGDIPGTMEVAGDSLEACGP